MDESIDGSVKEGEQSLGDVEYLSEMSMVTDDGGGGNETPNATNESGDDFLRQMMADLVDEPVISNRNDKNGDDDDERTSGALRIDEESTSAINPVQKPIEIVTSFNDDTEIITKRGAGGASSTAPLGSSSSSSSAPSAGSSNQSWRNDFVAAVQENKRKRKMQAEKVEIAPSTKPKKKKLATTTASANPDESVETASLDNISVKSATSASVKSGSVRSTRHLPEFTVEQKELFKAPLQNGYIREFVYRKTQKKGSEADVYYLTPNKIRLRSMPELDIYLRTTTTEKLKRDSFTFRRVILGFDEGEDVRGSLAPELASTTTRPSSSAQSSPVKAYIPEAATTAKPIQRQKPGRPKKKATATAPKSKRSKYEEDSEESSDDEDDDDEGTSNQASKPRSSLNLVNFKKDSAVAPKGKQPTASASAVVSTPKKKLTTPSSANSSKMQKLRKVAMTESQRKNAYLKSLASKSIPTIGETSMPAAAPVASATAISTTTAPLNTKNRARKTICTPFHHLQQQQQQPVAETASNVSSVEDGSETSSEQDYQVVTCADHCPIKGNNKWTSVPCVRCLRLFHKECLQSKGRLLGASLRFECGECTAYYGRREDDGDASATSRSTAANDGEMKMLGGGGGLKLEPSGSGGYLDTTVKMDVISVRSLFPSASANDTMPTLDHAPPCPSPPLDMSPDTEELQATAVLASSVNGDWFAQFQDGTNKSTEKRPFERFNAYVRALESIFAYLPVRDLMTARLVCITWNMVVQRPFVWRFARLRGCRLPLSEYAWPDAIDMMSRRGVEQLDLVGCRSISLGRFMNLALPGLSQFVNGFHYGYILPKLMVATSTMCGRNLRSITMTLTNEPTSTRNWISSNAFASLASCTELTELRVSAGASIRTGERVHINTDGLSALAVLTKLRILTLLDIKATDEKVFKFLESMNALRVLEIGDCQSWTRETYTRLRRLVNMRRLRLECFEAGVGGDALTGSLLSMVELREAEFVQFSLAASSASQMLQAVVTLPNLHTLRLYPDLAGKSATQTWRRTLDAFPQFANLKRLELGWTIEESPSSPANSDLESTTAMPFMSTRADQANRIAFINNEALGEWVADQLPSTVVNFSSANLIESRVPAKW